MSDVYLLQVCTRWNKNCFSFYVYDCVYWYTSEAIGKRFVDNLGKIFHVKFLGYSQWFMSIIIYQIKDHCIYVYQARYATSIVAKYLDIETVNTSESFTRPL